jgi:hypothetical protein
MSATQGMQSARRRPIPGMASNSIVEPPERPVAEPPPAPSAPGARPAQTREKPAATSQRSSDYSVTRLVNFRLPVDLHDRFRALVAQAEERHPRLRKASLTELVIALLEEGPPTADEVAELIRRKRLAEHEEG